MINFKMLLASLLVAGVSAQATLRKLQAKRKSLVILMPL